MKLHIFARNLHGYRPQSKSCSQGPFKIEICRENLIYSNIFACMNRAITLIPLKRASRGIRMKTCNIVLYTPVLSV
jgi:hypothetical protein